MEVPVTIPGVMEVLVEVLAVHQAVHITEEQQVLLVKVMLVVIMVALVTLMVLVVVEAQVQLV